MTRDISQEDEDLPRYKTVKRYNTPGHSHFLTFSCFRRQPFLSKDRTRQWLAGTIIAARSEFNFRIIAWVFMPEHVHLLINPRQRPYSISDILSANKTPVTRAAKRYITASAPDFLPKMLDRQPNGRQACRFWQRGGGYDRNIYSPDELWEKIDYIHMNPVKRKLVTRATDWQWSSATDYAGVRKGPLPVDNHDLPWRPEKR